MSTATLTADLVLLAPRDHTWHVLLIQRAHDPFRGMWALPGGHVDPGETFAEAAVRELAEEAGLVTLPGAPTRIGVYDKPDRDPRGRVVSVAYGLVLAGTSDTRAGSDAVCASWTNLNSTLAVGFPLAFDHRQILRDAHKTLITGEPLRQPHDSNA